MPCDLTDRRYPTERVSSEIEDLTAISSLFAPFGCQALESFFKAPFNHQIRSTGALSPSLSRFLPPPDSICRRARGSINC